MNQSAASSQRRSRRQGLQAFDDLQLTDLQRIILMTDGTVTELLETCMHETMQVRKLREVIGDLEVNLPIREQIENQCQSPILNRTILLVGENSARTCLYAESSIMLENLPDGFRHDLLHEQIPIGTLWHKYRVETYKEILDYRSEPAAELGAYFELAEDAVLLSRSYMVTNRGRAMMVITEKFPLQFFHTA